MARRILPFGNGEYYHIYNRGVAQMPVFFDRRDYSRFRLTFSYYRFMDASPRLSHFLELGYGQRSELLTQLQTKSEKLVDIVSFVMMPNHFHFLLRQELDGGISNFMRLLQNSFTKYINEKKNRVGSLFQGPFKAKHIETKEFLLHISRYIHLNPLVSFLIKEKDFLDYPWSSMKDYLKGGSVLIDVKPVLNTFASSKDYKNFVLDQADYAKELEKIKHLTFE